MLSHYDVGVIDSIVGLRSVAIGKVHLAQTMGATPWQIFTKIRLPSALPISARGT